MNKNIEVINENLWAVNSAYIRMGHSDEQLNFALDKMRKVSEPDAYEKMYLNVLEWEIKRRCVKADYLSSQPKPTFKDKIIKWMIRKKVRIWHLFKQE